MNETLSTLVQSVVSSFGQKWVNDFARTEEDEVTTLESLPDNVKSLCAVTCDVDEQIKEAERGGQKKRKRQVEEWLKQVQKVLDEYRALESQEKTDGFLEGFLHRGPATEINEKVKNLIQQHQNFGELLLDVYNVGCKFLTDGLVGEAFENNVEKIVTLLLEDDKVPKIGIYGMGGVGKTTLAKHINNGLLLKQTEVVWVTLSKEFSVRMLQDEIAKQLRLDLSMEYNEDKRAAYLEKVVSNKKNLVLIFDDIWESFDLIKAGIHGCRLMITTRSLAVCRAIGCTEKFEVKTLQEREAWILFKEKLGRETSLTPQVEPIAKSMVKLCGGLPLGITTLAGSMKGETELHAWKDALAELSESVMGPEYMEEKVFKVLKHSFDRLNRPKAKNHVYSKFQLCFLYCTLYSEDYGIRGSELIRMFIIEGFLDKRARREELFAQGNTILDKLVNLCLLERGYYNDSVKMHDLVRSMALKIINGDDRTKVMSRWSDVSHLENWTEDVERIFCRPPTLIQPLAFEMSPKCPKLSALILKSSFLPESFFSQMHSLCILNLAGSLMLKLPDSVSDLVHLRALILSDCFELGHVPYLGELTELRELDLMNTAIEEVPQGMEELIKLEYLSLHTNKLKMVPGGLLLNYPHLKCLYLHRNITAPAEEIGKLKELEEFCGQVKNVADFFHLIRSRQCLEYSVEVGSLTPYDPFIRCFRGHNKVVLSKYEFKEKLEEDGIWLVQGIRHLKLYKCEGLSNCIAEDLLQLHIDLQTIESLAVEKCGGRDLSMRNDQFLPVGEVASTVMSPLHTQAVFHSLKDLVICDYDTIKKLRISPSKFPCLETLCIVKCKMIEEVMEVAEQEGSVSGETEGTDMASPPTTQVGFLHLKELRIMWCSRIKRLGLPSKMSNLETIELSYCNMIEEIMELGRTMVSDPHTQPGFPRLQKFRIFRCNKLKRVGISSSQFPNLKDIDINYCGRLEEILELPEDIGGGECQGSLPKLERLNLVDLRQLKTICNATLVCNSIQVIKLWRCPALKKLPLVFREPKLDDSAPPTLKKIELRKDEEEWWKAMELVHPIHHTLLQPYLHYDIGKINFWEEIQRMGGRGQDDGYYYRRGAVGI